MTKSTEEVSDVECIAEIAELCERYHISARVMQIPNGNLQSQLRVVRTYCALRDESLSSIITRRVH